MGLYDRGVGKQGKMTHWETARKTGLELLLGSVEFWGLEMRGRKEVGGLGLRLRALYSRLYAHTLGRRRYLHACSLPENSGFMLAMGLGSGGPW